MVELMSPHAGSSFSAASHGPDEPAAALERMWLVLPGTRTPTDGDRLEVSPDEIRKRPLLAGKPWPEGWPLSLLTPRQLERSTSLQRLGAVPADLSGVEPHA